jgi:cytochrome P450
MDAAEIFARLLEPDGRADPYPLYARLHGLGPALATGPGFVLVTGYDAISAVLRDPAYQMSDNARMDELMPAWREHPSMSMEAMLNLNPPAHTRIRAVIARAFSARRVAALEPAIARMTDCLLAGMTAAGADGNPVDFMHDFAYLLPVTVICELLGVPAADRESFRPAARDLAATVEIGVGEEVLAAADKAAAWLHEYFAALAAERRADPRDDLLTALVLAADEGSLTSAELLDNLTLLLVAGFETTTNLLGNGLALLLADDAQAAALRAGAVPVASFVEEVLRFDSPVQLTSRSATANGEICGVPVLAGDEVILMLGAGNRDGRRFTQPDTFDPRRAVGGPLSFGAGPHFCVGAALARLEAAVAFPRLLARFPQLAAAGPAVRRSGLVLRGFDQLPVLAA